MGEEADIDSTIEIGGTYIGSKELELEESIVEEETKLKESDEVQTIRGTGRCNLGDMASLPSKDSSYSYF